MKFNFQSTQFQIIKWKQMNINKLKNKIRVAKPIHELSKI
jgi:hypothetical protein